MNLRDHLTTLLNDNHLTQLAVAGPWVCTVFCVADDKTNLYWLSLPDTRHSQTLEMDGNAAVAILAQAKPQIGLQAEGRVVRLTGDALQSGLLIWGGFFNKDEAWRQAIVSGENSHQLYRFTPRSWQLYDVQNYPDQPKQEISI